MRKRVLSSLLIVILILCSFINVKAIGLVDSSSSSSNLVKVSSTLDPSNAGSYKFDNFEYTDLIIYNNGDFLTFYTKITNKNSKTLPISFNILLFNNEMKNIGYFNYCSSADTETDYSYKKINSGEAVDFSINLSTKYLANSDDYTISDIAYYYVLNDNEYCKIGGYDKYEGLTLSEITSGTTTNTNSSSSSYSFIDLSELSFVFIICLVVGLIVGIIIYIVYGSILNNLHEQMYNKKNGLCYVPIANNYICFKLAFGQIIGYAYLGLFAFGILLSFLQINFVSVLVSIACLVAFIIDIIKLVTKNYDMCIIDLQNDVVVNDTSVDPNSSANVYGYTQNDNIKESMIGESTGNTLDFDNSNTNAFDYNGLNNNTNDNVDISYNNSNNNQNNSNNNDGDSDLSKFFR